MSIKHTFIAIAVALLAPAAVAQTNGSNSGIPKPGQVPDLHLQGGPGIVISASQTTENMPAAAQDFLKTYYGNDPVIRCHENFIKETYDVDLEDGTHILFNHDGKVRDINAGDYATIPAGAIKAILPAKTYKHLEQSGTLNLVMGIKDAGPKGFGVALLNNVPPQMIFDIDGTFVIVAE